MSKFTPGMKEVTIKIPEKRLSFFMELMRNLGFEATQKYDIPDEHVSIVRERIKNDKSNPEKLEEWDNVKDSLGLIL